MVELLYSLLSGEGERKLHQINSFTLIGRFPCICYNVCPRRLIRAILNGPVWSRSERNLHNKKILIRFSFL